MPRRSEIRERLCELLKSEINELTFYEDRRMAIDEAYLPSLTLLPSVERSEREALEVRSRTLRVLLEVRVKGETAIQELDSFAEEIEQVISGNETLGGLVHVIEYADTDWEFSEDRNLALMTIAAEVFYSQL